MDYKRGRKSIENLHLILVSRGNLAAGALTTGVISTSRSSVTNKSRPNEPAKRKGNPSFTVKPNKG